MTTKHKDHYFLKGGGEMGKLIRAKDWNKTSLGDPSQWPQSLCTTVAVMLDNPFAMYIAWGKDYIQLYNDAFRPILGESKHPQALGIGSRETFSEIWHTIGSMFGGVMKGKAVGFPDFMVPLHRNGYEEDCYFDFSYCPIRLNDGEVGGVLVTVVETTVKKKAEEVLKESNERFRNTFKQAPVGIIIFRGSKYIVEMANDACLRMVDKKENEFVGFPLFEAMPEIEDTLHELLDEVLNSGAPYHGNELPIPVNRFGAQELCYFDILYYPLREDDGQISGVIGTVIEVTEKVEARNTINVRKRLYEAVTQNTPDLIYVFDLDYRFTYVNEALLQMWGSTWDEAYGKSMLEIGYEPWHAEMHTKELDQVIATKKSIRGEVSFPHVKLGTRMYDYIFSPVINENGDVEMITGTTRDITDIKTAEEQFRLMAERMPQKIWTADAKGNRNYFNQVMLDYTGLTFDDLKDWGWEKMIHPDDWTETKQKWQHSITTGEDFENENRLKRHDGKYLWHLIRATAVLDEQGKPKFWIGSKTEIHQQVELSETLGENLKESDKRMETMLQHAPDAVISIDEDGIIKSWNQESESIFGWMKSEAIGKSLTETIIPARYRKQHDQGMKHFLNTGEGPVINKPIEISALRKDGSEFPIELKISNSKFNDRHMFIGFIRDISIRKKADETLQNKTNQLLEAQELAHIGSWDWDVVSNKIEWSDELYRIYGLSPQEFEADYDSYLKYLHPEDRDHVDSIVQQAFKDHQPYRFFHKIALDDGEVRILSSTGKVFTDSEGNVIRMSGTAQDVTDQKKYEEELKISEERFYKIFDSNPVPMSLAEVKFNKIKYANNLFYNTFGYSKEEVIGHTTEELNLIDPVEYKRAIDLIFDYLHENRTLEEVQALSVEDTEALLLKLKQSEKMKDFEILYTKKNGKKFPALISFDVIRIGTESYTVTSYLDITERKKAEALLKDQNEQLEKMNKELESFAYVSSHDLQEPLRKIQLFAARIIEKEQDNLSDAGKNMFSRMQIAANRMQTLIQDLLSYSRTNTSELKFENTDLNEIVAEVKEDLKEEIKEKNATVITNDLCHADIIRFQFRQLMHNLIGNSLKFSDPDHPPRIQIKSEIAKGAKFKNKKLSPHKNYCHIIVSDNGSGFEKQYNEKIFEVFQRLHGQNEYLGTGIGLSIVKKIVENHQGIITADGELNKGATFDIYIPATS